MLIPKTHAPTHLGKYRPISLGNFLGNRLARFLPVIVNEEQAGFVQGRHIAHHIVLAQELIRDLSN